MGQHVLYRGPIICDLSFLNFDLLSASLIQSFLVFFATVYHNVSRLMTKPTKWHVRPASCEDSDQPGHPPSLIRIFAVRVLGSLGPKLSSGEQRRRWSDWTDAQADLSLGWAHRSFCWFCRAVAHVVFCFMIWIFTLPITWRSLYWLQDGKIISLQLVPSTIQ